MRAVQTISSVMQFISPFKGKKRLGRIIMRATGIAQKKDICLKTKFGRFLLPNLIESISVDLFINGFYEKGLIQLLSKGIPPGGIFIDVGANIGSISIPVAKLRPDIKIIAIEASPWIFGVLSENVRMNDASNITVLNYAVYNESGKTLPMYAPQELFGKGSLMATFTRDSELVTTITLDDIKKKLNLSVIDYIKADVEGFEASVFMGMSEIAVSDKPKVIFEFSEWAETVAGFNAFEAQQIILGKGYKIQQLDENFNKLGTPVNSIHKVKNANLFAS